MPDSGDTILIIECLQINPLSSQLISVLWESQVVVPLSAHAQVFNLLHSSHPDIVRLKELARSCLVA